MDEHERIALGDADPDEESTDAAAPERSEAAPRAEDGTGGASPTSPGASAPPIGAGGDVGGIVYALTNERMPDLVKIGIVERGDGEVDLDKRVKELSRATGVPLPFEVHHAVRARDGVRIVIEPKRPTFFFLNNLGDVHPAASSRLRYFLTVLG